ncbi:hypothetical protein BH18ACI2_BH18ACI2_01500 [soil metagenome]
MTGASHQHNLITVNIGAELRNQLKGRACEVYQSDMRVHVPATGLYTYPNVIVVCGEPQLEDEHFDTLLNPTLIVEVLSKSTARYDRTGKFSDYRSILPSPSTCSSCRANIALSSPPNNPTGAGC